MSRPLQIRYAAIAITVFCVILAGLFFSGNLPTGALIPFTSSSRTLTLHNGGHPTTAAAKPSSPPQAVDGDSEIAPASLEEKVGSATNSTLGFSKILVVGLPERSDKRDAMTLTSAMTGFRLEWVDGIKGETVPDKALPPGAIRFGQEGGNLRDLNIGSWRGHLNAVRRIVEEGLESALIMEDDMDWDVRLKSQLMESAKGMRTLFPPEVPTSSPYGAGWDVLWLGHCGDQFPQDRDKNKKKPSSHPGIQYMRRKFTIKNDQTVPPRAQVKLFWNFRPAREHERYVHISGYPVCTFAYALSQRGARKVLFETGLDHLRLAYDNALAELCMRAVETYGDAPEEAGDRGLDTRCITVNPPLFYHHRAKGKMSGDSDIETGGDEEGTRDKGRTENIVWSARNNLRHMFLGEAMESQY